jgi:hypothetical protein
VIFILDEMPRLCAMYLDDDSLDAQIKTIAQVLCDVHHAMATCLPCDEVPTKGCKNCKDKDAIPLEENFSRETQPWRNWAMQSKQYYLWLVNLGLYCEAEWVGRHNTGDMHPCYMAIKWCEKHEPDLARTVEVCHQKGVNIMIINSMPLVMPGEFLQGFRRHDLTDDTDRVVLRYRVYFNALAEKKVLLYTSREKPKWMDLFKKAPEDAGMAVIREALERYRGRT